jgi:hypothetical protein
VEGSSVSGSPGPGCILRAGADCRLQLILPRPLGGKADGVLEVVQCRASLGGGCKSCGARPTAAYSAASAASASFGTAPRLPPQPA